MSEVKNEEVRMKNEKPAEAARKRCDAPSPTPEQGADSQLHCYNAVAWRLAEMFGDDNEPALQPKKQK